MIETKNEFDTYLEIYDEEFKILETTNGHLWNTNERSPISIAKSRINDYVESDIPAEEIEYIPAEDEEVLEVEEDAIDEISE